MNTVWNRALMVLIYIVGIFMAYSGVTTSIAPLEAMPGVLGVVFSHRPLLIAFGLVFFLAGISIVIGDVTKRRIWAKRGLMATYICFIFAALLTGQVGGWVPAFWIPNTIGAIVTGGLYLWYKERFMPTESRHTPQRVLH